MQSDPNLSYLAAAYAVFWLLTFVLVFSIWFRQRRLEREIAALEDRLGREG
ncbi:MAG: heme exporter protein CcmD [Anaerolineae bacterium]|nr:heme exporter protein CcmD [Anaerolineae bacterium]